MAGLTGASLVIFQIASLIIQTPGGLQALIKSKTHRKVANILIDFPPGDSLITLSLELVDF